MAYDLVIKNGTLVDGTGAAARQADVAIVDGKIAEIGRVTDGAATVIDAADLVVAPGFIDPHTHYDAQICWDGAVTPSSWHGVTSVIMGNCGVGIAPCKPKAREVAMRDLVNVEAIPFDVLNMGITWDWETFPEFIEAAARRNPSLNLGFLAPLTPFRHYVMGEASIERAATPDETAQIKALLGEAIDAGAVGFSTTILNQHLGFQGRPLACRNASRDEMKAYANALKKRGKGAIVDKSKPAQAAVYAAPAFRNQFREELKQPMAFGNWERIHVHEVASPALKALEGRSVADLAREQGKDGVDALLALTLQADLDIEFTM